MFPIENTEVLRQEQIDASGTVNLPIEPSNSTDYWLVEAGLETWLMLQ
jgi:hypothetical protein